MANFTEIHGCSVVPAPPVRAGAARPPPVSARAAAAPAGAGGAGSRRGSLRGRGARPVSPRARARRQRGDLCWPRGERPRPRAVRECRTFCVFAPGKLQMPSSAAPRGARQGLRPAPTPPPPPRVTSPAASWKNLRVIKKKKKKSPND